MLKSEFWLGSWREFILQTIFLIKLMRRKNAGIASNLMEQKLHLIKFKVAERKV